MHLVDPKNVNIGMLPCVLFQDKAFLPDTPAIYFVVAADAYEVVYIGCSRSLARRWRQHTHRYRFACIPNVLIYWYCVENVVQLYATEKLFIEYWNPLFNRTSQRQLAWLYRNKGYVKEPITLPRELLAWVHDYAGRQGLSSLVRYLLKEERARRS